MLTTIEFIVHIIIIMCIVDVDSLSLITSDCNNCGYYDDDENNTQSEYGFKIQWIFIVCSFCPRTQYLHVCKLVPTQTEFVRVLCTTSSGFPLHFFFFCKKQQHRSSQRERERKKDERERNHHNHQYTL